MGFALCRRNALDCDFARLMSEGRHGEAGALMVRSMAPVCGSRSAPQPEHGARPTMSDQSTASSAQRGGPSPVGIGLG